MTISILTLFPEMLEGPFKHSIIKRAQEKKLLKIQLVNIRQFATGRHRSVDDRPYGGGRGMILRVDVIDRAIKSAVGHQSSGMGKVRIILLDPQGKKFSQKIARKLSKFDHLVLVCGHYEGVDERVRNLVNEEISIGDYVLTGGEIPAMVVTDAIARLIPQVLKVKAATQLESFSQPLLEYPQYTRPPTYLRWQVPAILLSGHHAQIEKWRKKEAFKRTKRRRPDLTQKG